MKNVVIRDEKKREIIKINNDGRAAFARFPDLSNSTKEYIIEFYKEMTHEDPQKLIDFLNYKSETNEFCV